MIRKISTWVTIFAFLIGGIGFLIFFKSKNTAPEAMQINAVANPGDQLVYVTISGGKFDLDNLSEDNVPTRKANVQSPPDYYIPVLDGNSIIYILKTNLTPTLLEPVQKAHFSGFLQSKRKLPQKILEGYNTQYADADFFYLDSTTHPKTRIQKMQSTRIFFIVAIGGLIIRIIFRKRKNKRKASKM